MLSINSLRKATLWVSWTQPASRLKPILFSSAELLVHSGMIPQEKAHQLSNKVSCMSMHWNVGENKIHIKFHHSYNLHAALHPLCSCLNYLQTWITYKPHKSLERMEPENSYHANHIFVHQSNHVIKTA